MIDISNLSDWSPPANWREIQTIDAHTGGEPLRIVISGFPELKGSRRYVRRHHC